jgi:hypothetical protein
MGSAAAVALVAVTEVASVPERGPEWVKDEVGALAAESFVWVEV